MSIEAVIAMLAALGTLLLMGAGGLLAGRLRRSRPPKRPPQIHTRAGALDDVARDQITRHWDSAVDAAMERIGEVDAAERAPDRAREVADLVNKRQRKP